MASTARLLLALSLAGCAAPGRLADGSAHPSEAPVLWRELADLDGDGAPEEITLRSEDVKPRARGPNDAPWMNVTFGGACGEKCRALLRVGKASHEVNLRLRNTDAGGGLEIRVIDIDRSDGRKELLLRQQTGDDEISWSAVDVATYGDGRLKYHPLWGLTWPGNQSEVSIDGEGSITLRFAACAQTTLVRYRLEAMQLTKVDERVQISPQAAECPG